MVSKKKLEEIERKAEQEKRAQIIRALKATEIQLPKKEEFTLYPTEYSKFLEELKQKPITWYEVATKLARKILPVKPSVNAKIKLEESLKAAYINTSAEAAYSLAFLSTILTLLFVLLGIAYGGGLVFALIGFLFAGGVYYYFYNYPMAKAKSMSVKMSADTVLAVLYMVIYMRSSPNLEGAIRFAAQNMKGPLSWDLKKLLWDIEVGTYPSADAALVNYIYKWKDKNKDFAEALHLLRGISVEPARRDIIFNETIDVILTGTRERAKHYAAGLQMPMMLIHAMGVLLPVMGLVLFPVVLIFISNVVKPVFIFFGYDILLPVILYFIVNYVLQSKPPTFSQPDISAAKGVPPIGKFAIGKLTLPIWPLAILLALPLIIIGLIGIANSDVYISVSYSLLFIFGLAFLIIVYTFLDSFQKMKIRNDIERIEDEFSVALFQLGNTLSSGAPIEIAIDRSRDALKNLKISEMFEIVSLNMKKFGYTFEQALFDKEVGALWYYPSKLIQSIMQTIVQSSYKSVRFASDSMIVISNYLKGVHDVKEEIEDILGDTASSMKFLSMFLAPLVAGVTVTMAVVILQILTSLGQSITGIIGSAGNINAAQSFFTLPWLLGTGGTPPITPATFQIIVGIYMIETAVLLAIFLNGIKYGDDVIGMRNNIWNVLLIGIIVYSISWLVTYAMFGGAIQTLLTPVGT